MKRRILFLLLAVLSLSSHAETFLLDVGIEQFIPVPDVPYGVVDYTKWDCDVSNVTFVEQSNSGATIKITSYFDNAATVSLLYVVKYYDNKGFTRSYTQIKYFSVQCKGTAPMIVPSGINMKVGETYQLHISPSSYESQVVWSNYTIATNVNSSGMVTAKRVGEDIVFATLPNSSTPLTCLIYVRDTKLSLNANVSSGTIERGTEVKLTANKNTANIYYTLDGSSPEMNGELYTSPLSITKDATLKAIAYDDNFEPSDMLTRTYTVLNSDASELDNTVYIDSETSFAGDEMSLPIKMKNSSSIYRFQFNLYLPECITAVKNAKDKIQISLCTNRLAEDDEHLISATEQGDGSIFVQCYSQYDDYFIGNEGDIANIKVKIAEATKKGNYTINLKNIRLTTSDNISYETSNFSSTLTVLEYIKGDANGNQVVDDFDFMDIASYIHGERKDEFVEGNADVDGNGVIDVSDYIGVANLIRMGSIYGNALHASIITNEATSVEEKSAKLNGTLSVISATLPYTVGFFVSSDDAPSNDNYMKKIECGSNKINDFSSTIADLSYSTTYYYCSYLLYDGVYYYGETKCFTTTKKTTFNIGDLYPNDENPVGFVFSLNSDRKSGKIASLTTTYTEWYPAKSWANSYGSKCGDGRSWYLPSSSELQQIARNYSLFIQRNLIYNSQHWSSEKDVMSSGSIWEYAYVVGLNGGSKYSRRTDQSYRVIAVRSF